MQLAKNNKHRLCKVMAYTRLPCELGGCTLPRTPWTVLTPGTRAVLGISVFAVTVSGLLSSWVGNF